MPPRLLVASALLLGACDPEASRTCPFEQTTRIVELPSGSTDLHMHAPGDLIAYEIGEFDRNASATLIDPCTGATATYGTPETGRLRHEELTTPHGRLLYGITSDGAVLVLDRRDVAGFDEPHRIADLPAIDAIAQVTGGALLCTRDTEFVPDDGHPCWLHDGDPAHPPAPLGESVMRWSDAGPQLILHDTSGDLRSLDITSGTLTTIATGVRNYGLATPARHLVFATASAGDTVNIQRRDLETGDELTLAQNLTLGDGTWKFNGDGTAAGFAGVFSGDHTGPFEVLFRLDTGAALSIPAHIGVSSWGHGPEFELRLAGAAGLHTRAYWNPFTPDAPRVWFNQPSLTWGGLHPTRSGDLVTYSVSDICAPARTHWQLDLRTGDRVQLVDAVQGPFIALEDGRYLTAIAEHWSDTFDIVVVDPDTLQTRTIAAAVNHWSYRPAQGLVYAYDEGEQAGIWTAPLPPADAP